MSEIFFEGEISEGSIMVASTKLMQAIEEIALERGGPSFLSTISETARNGFLQEPDYLPNADAVRHMELLYPGSAEEVIERMEQICDESRELKVPLELIINQN